MQRSIKHCDIRFFYIIQKTSIVIECDKFILYLLPTNYRTNIYIRSNMIKITKFWFTFSFLLFNGCSEKKENINAVSIVQDYCKSKIDSSDKNEVCCTKLTEKLDILSSPKSIRIDDLSTFTINQDWDQNETRDAFQDYIIENESYFREQMKDVGCTTTTDVIPELEEPVIDIDEDTRTFAVAVAQNLRTYSSPDKFSSQDVTILNILEPYEVSEKQDSLGSDNKRRKWVHLLDKNGSPKGWIEEDLVYYWNNRHALEPRTNLEEDMIVHGYCSAEDVQSYLKGKASPCIQFDTQSVEKQGTRAPFLVVDGKTYVSEGGKKNTFLEVLVPTLYSNMVPLEKNTKITAGLAEIIVFIDASSSMTQEIRDTAKSISDTLIDISRMPNFDIKVMVIAYRDLAENPECTPVESIVDSNNKPQWVSPSEAVSFLETIETCRTLDDPEALWDALYTLRDIQVTGGAKRALIVAGDAPSWDETRGANIFGTQVPRGLSSSKVLREITKTIGRSSLFIGVVVEKGIQSTFKTLQSKLPFSQTQLLSVNKNSNIQQLLTDEIQTYLESLNSNVKAEEECQREVQLSPDDPNQQVPLFCGLADDENFSRRVADLVVQNDDVVIRKIWIEETQATTDVILLSKMEAARLAKSLRDVGEKMLDGDEPCSKLGPNVWAEVIGSIVGSTPNISEDNQPNVSDFLHKYWKIHSGNQSLLRMQPSEIMDLPKDQCNELGERLTKAEQKLNQKLNQSNKLDQYIWFPLSNLP